jgi:hypothetical protein
VNTTVGQRVFVAQEEELGLFFELPWRWRSGWRPDLVGLRGPAIMPAFVHSPFGVWRYHRHPARLIDVGSEAIVGARVTKIDQIVGSYGMGSPGFLGIKLKPARRSQKFWIVITLWNAATWAKVNDALLVEGYPFEDEQRQLEHQGYSFTSFRELVDGTVARCDLNQDTFVLTVHKDGGDRTFEIDARSGNLPLLRGNGEPRRLADDQSLLDAVVISRRANLWLT